MPVADYGYGQEINALSTDGGDFLFPGSGSPYVTNPPLAAAPMLPALAHNHNLRLPIYPQFDDIGTRAPVIGADFRKRQYIGV